MLIGEITILTTIIGGGLRMQNDKILICAIAENVSK
jgi:hypothetical protein